MRMTQNHSDLFLQVSKCRSQVLHIGTFAHGHRMPKTDRSASGQRPKGHLVSLLIR